MDPIKVLVADDSGFMNIACKRILATQDHLTVVGMAADGEEAVLKARELEPDVAVFDVRMPKLSGIEAARQIKSSRPGTGIVMMSNYDDPEYVAGLMEGGLGGKAYLLKPSVEDVYLLIRAVEAVAAGGTMLDPMIVQRLERIDASIPSLLSQSLLAEREKVVALMAE